MLDLGAKLGFQLFQLFLQFSFRCVRIERRDPLLLVSLKGSREPCMRLTVDKVRHLLSPAGKWLTVATGQAFTELVIHHWSLICDDCDRQLNFEFAVDSVLGETARAPAAEQRLLELG